MFKVSEEHQLILTKQQTISYYWCTASATAKLHHFLVIVKHIKDSPGTYNFSTENYICLRISVWWQQNPCQVCHIFRNIIRFKRWPIAEITLKYVSLNVIGNDCRRNPTFSRLQLALAGLQSVS